MTRYTAGQTTCVDRVFLNGREVDEVIEADDQHGFVIQLVLDENGQPEREGDHLKTRVLVGKVTVTMKQHG